MKDRFRMIGGYEALALTVLVLFAAMTCPYLRDYLAWEFDQEPQQVHKSQGSRMTVEERVAVIEELKGLDRDLNARLAKVTLGSCAYLQGSETEEARTCVNMLAQRELIRRNLSEQIALLPPAWRPTQSKV